MNSWLKHVAVATSILLAAGCVGGSPSVPTGGTAAAAPPEPAASETTALMLRHYEHARDLTSAAIFGDSERARAAAASIRNEEPVPGMSDEQASVYRDFLDAVAAVDVAEGREDLAMSAATVAVRCGACHLASGLGPSFTVGRPVEPVTARDHILVLDWGSSRLWESLVGGSDLAWRAGARALSGQRLREDLYASRVSDLSAARALGADLHDLGVRALALSEPDERAELLGEVWGTCSGCHELAGLSQ